MEKKSSYLFKFSEIKVDVGLGIADTVNPSRRILYSSKGYYSGLGQFKQGDGFQAEEEVIMEVDLSLGLIEWRVNNKIRNVYHKKIRDPEIKWAVALYLCC